MMLFLRTVDLSAAKFVGVGNKRELGPSRVRYYPTGAYRIY